MKLSFGLLFFFILSVFSTSNAQDFFFKDYTYQSNIKSVKFHLLNLELTYPIIDLNSSGQLHLSFDELDEDVKDYNYTVIHCDADWTPSDLSEMEYLRGFAEDRIDDFNYSFSTFANYTHYDLFLPNEDIAWTKSGNYLLVVKNEDTDEVIITRRFIVVDPVVKIEATIQRANDVSKIRTHQEIDFRVNYESLRLRNPQQEIWATIQQNWRTDNAIVDIKPLFVRRDELIFDFQNQLVFPAGNEFRFFDMRDFQNARNNIALIERLEERYDVAVMLDERRGNQSFISNNDINGQFIIETLPNQDPNTRGDYANVLFTYKTGTPFLDGKLYLFGALTDWQLKEEFEMIYNPAVNSYVLRTELKQGFYNYAYAYVQNGKKNIILDDTEGNWVETLNDYTIIIYHRPFGSRYDHVVGAYTAVSDGRR